MIARVVIQTEDFNVSQVLDQLRAGDLRVGAICSFVGTVRDTRMLSGNAADQILSLELEHYPGMTEKALLEIETLAIKRWHLDDVYIVHRYGKLNVGEPIVGIVVFAKHRKEAFESCHFIIDFLKTDAPFWKKEITSQKSYWVDAKTIDDDEKKKWN